MKKPLLSIITVCYNAAGEIGKTIESVLAQNFTDLEYLFVDGKSGDGTVEIIESYRGRFDALGISFRVVSEPDKGIYDAMNKGIGLAAGEWTLMLNAGDVFVSAGVLEKLFRDCDGVDVLYGDAIFREEHRGKVYYRKMPAKDLSYFDVGMPFCHQSVFARSETLRRYPFDTAYRLVADYDQFYRMYRDGVPFRYAGRYVSVFDGSGVSMKNPLATMQEYGRVRKQAGIPGRKKVLLNTFLKTKAALRNLAKQCLPGMFFSKARGWQREFPDC